MKKFIAMAVAAGGLALGGAASAQDLGQVITNILGFGAPSYIFSQPADRTIYSDQYGQRFYYDDDGRKVIVQSNVYGATPYGITGYDAWGRPIYGGVLGNYAQANRADRDGDGVTNRFDRWPDDPRYR